jgi:uncharacterized delta-60 repeat protein
MSKVFLSLFLVLFFTLPLFAQSVDTAWVRKYNGTGSNNDISMGIAVDGSGNVIVSGYSDGGISTHSDYLTIKYNPDGDTVWLKRYNDPANGYDTTKAMIMDNSGNIYVTGYTCGNPTTKCDYLTLKYLPNGELSWVGKYNGTGSDDDKAQAIGLDGSGNVYVTGYSSDGIDYNIVTIKYLPGGDTVWVRKFPLAGAVFSIAVDNPGNYYLAGATVDSSQVSYLTVKCSTNGTCVSKTYNGPGDGMDAANDVTVDDSGYIYVTGFSTGIGTERDYLTIKYKPDLSDTVWVRRYCMPGGVDEEIAQAIEVDDSGNVYVTGAAFLSGTGWLCATIKYNSDGDSAWTRKFRGASGGGPDKNFTLTLDNSNNIYVAGGTHDHPEADDFATMKYYPNGDSACMKRYNGSANLSDWANAIVTDDSGNVYVTGWSSSDSSSYPKDFVTIKYVQFLRGNVNGDGKISLSDIVYLINYLFKFGPAPVPIQSGDANCDGKVSLGDIVYLINYLFKFGPAPCI